MRISDEERRETVENLRRLSYTNRVRYKEEFYELLDETVMEPDTGYHEMNDVFERIADLIDRPTCLDLVDHKQDPFIPGKRMVDGYFHCSDCGWDGRIWEHIGFGDMLAYEAVHCPKCGAIIKRCA